MKKTKGSIYSKLVFSYIVFSVLVLLSLVVCLWFVAFLQTQGTLQSISPYNITTQASCLELETGIAGLGGWTEHLDESYVVTDIYGTKQTDIITYQTADLLELTNGNKSSDCPYIGFLNKATDREGYYLIIYHRADVELRPTFMYSAENTDARWNTLVLCLFFSIFIGLCLMMGSYLSRRIRKPLRNISAGMEQMKAGNRAVTLAFEAEAEFAEIRDTFNLMSAELEQAELEKESAEAKKNKMLLELSHDIRTPVSTINSFAIALEQDMVVDKQEYYRTIRMKAARISDLVDDMFTVLKMKSAGYSLHKTQADICEFLRVQCAEYYQPAQEVNLAMNIDIPETKLLYTADYDLLARAIGNLLSNAIKYNRTGHQLAVALQQTAHHVFITVSDDGSPIASNLRDTLFDDFSRGDTARKSDGGTGLGLSITKTIIEKHNGTVSYQCENSQNIFCITLNLDSE